MIPQQWIQLRPTPTARRHEQNSVDLLAIAVMCISSRPEYYVLAQGPVKE